MNSSSEQELPLSGPDLDRAVGGAEGEAQARHHRLPLPHQRERLEKLNEPEASTSDKPESVRVLRNRKVIISPDTLITKYNSLTFSYFTYTFLNSISIEIYKLSFVNFLSFLKEETNNIYESIVMSFSKFNLTLKNYTWLKALS